LNRATPLKLTFADLVLACGLAALAGLLAVTGDGGGGVSGSHALVRSSGGEVLRVDLDRDRTLAVLGPRGTTLLRVGDGRLRFVDSPCAHKVCVERGEITRPGEWIACVPNGVVAIIEGERAYDRITP